MAIGPYDALLVVSFGGPEGPDDVLPFLSQVTKGRGVPPERLAEVARQYDRFGGVSPINGQVRALVAALEDPAAGLDGLPVRWGNRNSRPWLVDAVAGLAGEGFGRVAAFVTSAFPGYSSCRQYREDIATARAAVGPRAPVIDKLLPYGNHAGFVEAVVARVAGPWAASMPGAVLIFTAHSIPTAAAAGSDYEAAIRESCALVADGVGATGWELAFQSRSGAERVPWLGPDVGERIEALAAGGVPEVVVVPIGFTSDHMEIVYDLDTLAAGRAARAGIRFTRAATVGTHPAFVSMVGDLVREAAGLVPTVRLGARGAQAVCGQPACCVPPRRP